jgi:hypothetical protein
MLSRFNAGCDCDCCIVYKSEFCKNWYESVFERKYFGSIDGNPSRMNLNGGTFDQLGVLLEEGGQFWEIRNDACASGITSCETSTDSKGWKYSADHYLTPTGNLASSYLSTILVASKYQWWLHTFWDTCDSSDSAACWDSSTNAPVRNQKMLFAFDYKDKNNWVGIEVEYKPDFDVTPGGVENVFEIRGRQNVSGTATYITNAFTVDLGTGSTKKEVGIEINVDQRTECGTNKFVAIDFGGSSIGFDFVTVDGDRCAMTQATPSGVVDNLNCSGTDYSVGAGFGIYTWVNQYLDGEKTGCATYAKGCCDCYTPQELDVTFSGFSSCDACTELNETFTLVKNRWTLGCVNWGYTFDAYDPPTCTKEIGGKDVVLQLDGIGIFLLNNVYYLQINATINVLDSMPPGCGIGSCDYFVWKFTEGSTTPPNCHLTTSDSWAYLTNNSSRELDGCECIMSFDNEYFNLSDFCSVGTVTVENG